MLNTASLKSKYSKKAYTIALLSTFLWAINPVNTQAVTYIIQRMASMAGMFYILSMYLYLKARISTRRYGMVILYSSCTIAFIFALGSKENSIMLPVSLLLFEFLILRKGSCQKWLSKNILLLIIGATGVIVILFSYLYCIKGGDPLSFLSGYHLRVFSLKERILTEPGIVLFYISLLLYPMPTRLSFFHDITISDSIINPPLTTVYILSILGFIIAAFMISKKRPLIAFCILFFFANHIVESTIIPLELVYEHRNYIPSMLFFIPPAIFLLNAISYFSYSRFKRTVITLSILSILVGIGHSTFIRNFVWKSEESLWIDCIDKYPNLWRPYHNLGKYYSDTNQHEKAIKMYNISLNKKVLNNRLDKQYFVTYFNLGVEYTDLGLYDKAMYYYLKAEESHSTWGSLQNNIGLILLKQNKLKDAKVRFQKALRYQPDHRQARSNLDSIK